MNVLHPKHPIYITKYSRRSKTKNIHSKLHDTNALFHGGQDIINAANNIIISKNSNYIINNNQSIITTIINKSSKQYSAIL